MWMNNKVIFFIFSMKDFHWLSTKKMPAYFSSTALQLDL